MKKIFESPLLFHLFDYKITHRRLLLRATDINFETKSFENTDIIFISTCFVGIGTSLEGIEIFTGSDDRTILFNNTPILLKGNSYYEIISEGKSFFISASSISINSNTMDTMTSSLPEN